MTHPNMGRTEHTPPLPLEVLHSTIELVTDVSNFDDAAQQSVEHFRKLSLASLWEHVAC